MNFMRGNFRPTMKSESKKTLSFIALLPNSLMVYAISRRRHVAALNLKFARNSSQR